MPRFAVAVTLLAVAGSTIAAPVPKAKPKATFHPTAVGTKWQYIRNGDETVVFSEEVIESEEKDGVISFRIQVTPNIGQSWSSAYTLGNGQFKVTQTRNFTYESPPLLGTAGMKDGDKWTEKYAVNAQVYEVSSVVGKSEELTTPAGKFTATPVTRTYVRPKIGGETVWWFAEGVGLVRQTANGSPVQELKSFAPGSDKK